MAAPGTGRPLSPWVFSIAPNLDQKRSDLGIYRSQLTSDEVQAVLDYRPGAAETGPAERVWADGRSPGLARLLTDLGFRHPTNLPL